MRKNYHSKTSGFRLWWVSPFIHINFANILRVLLRVLLFQSPFERTKITVWQSQPERNTVYLNKHWNTILHVHQTTNFCIYNEKLKCLKTITSSHLEPWSVRGYNLKTKSRLCVKWEDDVKEKTPLHKEVGNNEATEPATRWCLFQ